MKFSHKFELFGCDKNIVTISLSINTDMQKDISLFMEKLPEIEELLKFADKNQATLEQFSNEEKEKLEKNFKFLKNNNVKIQQLG